MFNKRNYQDISIDSLNVKNILQVPKIYEEKLPNHPEGSIILSVFQNSIYFRSSETWIKIFALPFKKDNADGEIIDLNNKHSRESTFYNEKLIQPSAPLYPNIPEWKEDWSISKEDINQLEINLNKVDDDILKQFRTFYDNGLENNKKKVIVHLNEIKLNTEEKKKLSNYFSDRLKYKDKRVIINIR